MTLISQPPRFQLLLRVFNLLVCIPRRQSKQNHYCRVQGVGTRYVTQITEIAIIFVTSVQSADQFKHLKTQYNQDECIRAYTAEVIQRPESITGL